MRLIISSIATIFLILALGIGSAVQAQDKQKAFTVPVTVIPGFEEEVYKYIREPDSTVKIEGAYYSRLLAMIYEDDKLVLKTKDSSPMEDLFRSFFHWHHDTLLLSGTYCSGEKWKGFSMKIHDGMAQVVYTYEIVHFPENVTREGGSNVYCQEIPVREVQVVLNEKPDSTTQVLFGYVKFKSGEYQGDSFSEKYLPKPWEGIRRRADMKIYFRSDRVQ
jgi:hypothetical protein